MEGIEEIGCKSAIIFATSSLSSLSVSSFGRMSVGERTRSKLCRTSESSCQSLSVESSRGSNVDSFIPFTFVCSSKLEFGKSASY